MMEKKRKDAANKNMIIELYYLRLIYEKYQLIWNYIILFMDI